MPSPFHVSDKTKPPADGPVVVTEPPYNGARFQNAYKTRDAPTMVRPWVNARTQGSDGITSMPVRHGLMD